MRDKIRKRVRNKRLHRYPFQTPIEDLRLIAEQHQIAEKQAQERRPRKKRMD